MDPALANHPEWQKAQAGDMYRAFVPELIQVRAKCSKACDAYNSSTDASRRGRALLWRDITGNGQALPPPAATVEADDELLAAEPWVEPPVRADFGVNVFLGQGAFINFNATFIDTCPIRIGARTLVGPYCAFYSGGHPLDPAVRNGLEGPEFGKPIEIGDDCWLGGNVTVLPGVTIGRGSTVGAGSVVTKDVPPFHVVAGNPARIIRKIESSLDPSQNVPPSDQQQDINRAQGPKSQV